MLHTLSVVLSAAFKLFTLYFLVVGLFCLLRPKRPRQSPPATRFACLIAARNEEAVINRPIQSLLTQRYPQELVDIWVIPNNCTDHTEEIARSAGAKIFSCTGAVRCKGDALHQAFAHLLPMGYDAFCVFDADNLVDEHFLARMNDAFAAGAKVAKSAMRAQNPGDSWVAGCYGLYFTLNDLFYNRARANCRLSVKLAGTGFAVRREVLEELGGWNTVTIAEDAEFSARCVAAGHRVWFVPDALIHDEGPNSLTVSLRQRKRWCSGIMSVAEKTAPALTASLKKGNFRAADMLMFLLAPFAQALSPIPTLLSLLAGGSDPLALLLAAGAAWVGTTLLGLILAVLGRYAPKEIAPAVLLFPLFMATWLPLQVLSLVRRTREWKVIAHGQSLSPAKLK